MEEEITQGTTQETVDEIEEDLEEGTEKKSFDLKKNLSWALSLLKTSILKPKAVIERAAENPKRAIATYLAIMILTIIPLTAVSVQTIQGAPEAPLTNSRTTMNSDEGATAPQDVSPAAIPIGIIGAFIVLGFTWAIKAAFVMGLSRIWGEKTSFLNTLPFVGLTYLPFALRNLLQTLYIAGAKTPIIHKGLSSMLISSGGLIENMTSPAYRALTKIDVFFIWSAFLLFLVMQGFARLPKKRALMAAASWWGILILLAASSAVFI